MSQHDRVPLELDDIQAGVLRGRPTPYAGALLLLGIDDPQSGRALAGRLAEVVPAAADLLHPETDASISVAFTDEGLRALGVPHASLESFPTEFREGMAARAALLGDVGPEDPSAWEAPVLGSPRLHRILRRSATYGPRLPPATLEDDGADRGLLLIAVNAHLARQFEFVQSHWINDGRFIGEPAEVDPLVASHAVHDSFTIPQRPIRKRLRGLPTFVRNRGGHYGFIPSRRALRWLAELESVRTPA